MKNKLKIGIVARIGMPITQTAMGYYYRICHIVNGLQKKGHQVTLVGHPGSKIQGKLFPATRKKITFENQLYYYSKFFKKYSKQFDIINCQTDHVCTFFDNFIKTPVLHTIIFGSFWQEIEDVLKWQRNKKYSTVSKAMLKRYPYLNWQGFVYNGVDTQKFSFNSQPKDYFLAMTRLCKEKGIDVAIKLAKKAGVKLYLAGPAGEIFYKEEIRPHLSSKIKYLGELKFKEKIKVLKNAKALLHPHQEPEGFGNSFIESMSCGTPVISSNLGSPPEIITHQKDGFICKNQRDYIRAIKNIDQIDRGLARKKVEDKFTIEKMVDGYEKLYYKVLKKK